MVSQARRRRILMAVYNEIEFDGRVQRAAEALSSSFEVFVVSPGPGTFSHPAYQNLRVQLPRGGRAAIPLRHLGFLAAVCRHALRLRPDVVYAHDFVLGATGRVAATVSGARLVYDAHELIVPTEQSPTLDRRTRFFYEMERRSAPAAALVIAANEPRAEIMRRHYGLRRTPLVIRNLSPAPPRIRARDELLGDFPQLARRASDVVRVVYQGDMSKARGIGQLIEALTHLDRRFEAVLVGGGPDLGRFLERAEQRRVRDRVISLGKLNRDRLADVMADCEVGFLTYVATDANNYYCAPNKVFEYAHVGLPMIAVGSPYLRSVVEDAGIGVGLDAADATAPALARAIETLSDRRSAYLSAVRAFSAANQWEAEADKLRTALTELIAG